MQADEGGKLLLLLPRGAGAVLLTQRILRVQSMFSRGITLTRVVAGGLRGREAAGLCARPFFALTLACVHQ